MKRQICFALAVILSCQPLIGCTTWRVQALPPQEIVHEWHPDKVRVRLTDGGVLVLDKPGIVGDSLVAGHGTSPRALDSSFRRKNPSRQSIQKPVGVPVTAIKQLEVRQISAGKTIALLLPPLIAYVALALALRNAQFTDPNH